MKNHILLFLFISFSIFSNGQVNNKINLQLSKEYKFGKDYFILEVQNNSESKINLIKSAHESFWCFSEPCINFIAETKKGDKWVLLHGFKSLLRDAVYNWSDPRNRIEISPSSKKKIGEFYFYKGIDQWFGLIGNQTIRLSVEYSIGSNETDMLKLKKLGYKPINLESNKIQIDYFDKKNTKDNISMHTKIFKHLIKNNHITEKKIKENEIIIDKPKDAEDALKKGLKNNILNIQKWSIITSFYQHVNVNNTYSRIIIFTNGIRKFVGISTQMSKLNDKDNSDKYNFSFIELNYP